MQTGRLKAFNFQKWIDEHKHLLKPPVGNKLVFEEGDKLQITTQSGSTFSFIATFEVQGAQRT